jgi:hypothetical protein
MINVVYLDAAVSFFQLEKSGDLLKQFRDLWKELHCKVDPTAEWFDSWVSRIPSIDCDCRSWIRDYLLKNPSRFNDWFRFTWELHNAVNVKLDHQQITMERAIRRWRPTPPISEKVTGCKIVTAFGLKRIERQQHCLESWLRSGFGVVALQTAEELETLRPNFDGVSWIEENNISTVYNFQTQRIQRLVSESKDEPVLLLNSDCCMTAGDGLSRFKQHLQEGKPKFYVRWNYANDQEFAAEFQWGLDGLLLWPEDVAAIPKDCPYSIGHAMWDYAVPIFLQQHGRGFSIDHYPWLMHLDHPQNWIEESWQIGFNWLHLNGYEVDYDSMRNGRYRKSLDPQMYYLGSKWV